jgi:hypothetical protein
VVRGIADPVDARLGEFQRFHRRVGEGMEKLAGLLVYRGAWGVRGIVACRAKNGCDPEPPERKAPSSVASRLE